MGGIYLDYNASTPVAPAVVRAMRPLLAAGFGNPSSGHWASHGATEALDHARRQVAELLHAAPETIVFTSGGSESNNAAIKGVVMRALRQRPGSAPHVIISAIEHPAVVEPCAYLRGLGARITEVSVDRQGRVDPEAVRQAIDDETVLISVMHANNEVGTLQPIAEIAAIARERSILVHSDAAQSVGKVATNVDELGVDMLTVAGHKLYAPKGIGALYVREGVALDALVHGAGHEGGRRAGTESAVMAAGLGAACELARTHPCAARLTQLREHFYEGLRAAFGDAVVLNGHPTDRLPNTLNVSFVDALAPDILASLDGVAASTGSACHAGSRSISPVLAKMGIEERVALGAIRFSLGRPTTIEEVDKVIDRLREVV